MLKKLQNLSKNTYSPYSNFPVAAIVVTNNSQMFKGVNIENASFRLTTCAEVNAIAAAISEGYTKKDFAEIHLFAPKSKEPVTPCGACRQVLIEFFQPEKKLISYSLNKTMHFKINQLLPNNFDNKDL